MVLYVLCVWSERHSAFISCSERLLLRTRVIKPRALNPVEWPSGWPPSTSLRTRSQTRRLADRATVQLLYKLSFELHFTSPSQVQSASALLSSRHPCLSLPIEGCCRGVWTQVGKLHAEMCTSGLRHLGRYHRWRKCVSVTRAHYLKLQCQHRNSQC